jgi:hypothetical protein
MTASARGRTSFTRTLVALGAVALLALLAFAALLFSGAFGDHGAATGSAHRTGVVAASGDHRYGESPGIHAIHQQPSTRARGVAFAVLASVVVGAALAFRRVRLAPVGRARTFRTAGLPPGRAPPVLRIA